MQQLNKSFYKQIALLLLILTPQISNAQEMATTMHSNGKIYVVVTVLVTIFIGLFIFLMSLDKKIKKIESEINNNTH